MGVEIIQDQMNGAHRGITVRDPFERPRKLARGTIFGGVGLMATGFGLDHAEHVGRAAARVLVVAAREGWPGTIVIFNNCYQNFGIMNATTMAGILRSQDQCP
jgi:hypothetical protein